MTRPATKPDRGGQRVLPFDAPQETRQERVQRILAIDPRIQRASNWQRLTFTPKAYDAASRRAREGGGSSQRD